MPDQDQPLSLSHEAEEAGLDIEHRISLAAQESPFSGLDERKFNLKRQIALWLLGLFIVLNAVVIVALIVLGVAEWNAIKGSREIERLVTSEVIMAVLGATTVQLGAIVFAMARHFFPSTGAPE